MLVECVPRPELKEPVLELIRRVSTAHEGGNFAIPMADMFSASGLTLDKADRNKARKRGEVKFMPRGTAHGEFVNKRREQESATEEGLTLVVPATLPGPY